MIAKFNDGGYEINISDSGYIPDPRPGFGHCGAKGSVGLQILHYPVTADEGVPVVPDVVYHAYMKPSQARAIASALLSAATEAKAAQQ